MHRYYSFPAYLAVVLLLAVVLSACSAGPQQVASVPPTKTPKPTFTPTTVPTPLPIVTPTLVPTSAPPTPTVAPTSAPPTATPAPQFSASQNVNVRMGPGTAYPVIGQVTAGQNYRVMATNADGSWWQFNYNGDPGWVIANLVTFAGDAKSVEVAQNIPAPPTPRPVPTAAPQPKPQTQPQAKPQPAAQPCNYEYCRPTVPSCRPQKGGTWFDGTVTKGGQPVDGVRVVWSGGGPDGAWATEPVITGPHQGYPGWNHGYFSHLVSVSKPRKGDWWVWLVDASGKRISDVVKWHSDGDVAEGTGCNDATVKFTG